MDSMRDSTVSRPASSVVVLYQTSHTAEEFMAMLLTFSLDFPPSTVEVIQEMVYMNSATLDGRRFAADFCARRKADAANRPRAAGGKQPSLADGESRWVSRDRTSLMRSLSCQDATKAGTERVAV